MQWIAATLTASFLVMIATAIARLVRNRQQSRAAILADQEYWLARARQERELVTQPTHPIFAPFRVMRREAETSEIVSLYLEPTDGATPGRFEPGQFIGIECDTSDAPTATRRCYSLTSIPGAPFYRVSVKRVPGGLGSGWLHDHVDVGQILQVSRPAGSFTPMSSLSDRLVLIAGGVGVTPFVSTLATLAGHNPYAEVFLFYSVRSGQEHAFRDELAEIADTIPRFRLITIYTQPDDTDIRGIDFDDDSRLSGAAILSVVGREDCEFYFCGPSAMIDGVTRELLEEGVPEQAIHSERFAAATSLVQAPSGQAGEPSDSDRPQVVFQQSGRTVAFQRNEPSLLHCAERNGVPMESLCRAGDCGSCKIRLLSGAVESDGDSALVTGPGSFLPCVSRPVGDVVINA